ncbi:MAG: electron transfer flavoprotein subunit beta [Gammaproteobacteria bacterium]
MMLDIAVLVSAGRHPVSGRPRCAPNDARALELALTLVHQYGGSVFVLHAGDPEQPALPGYLGMGVAELHVLPVPHGKDSLPALADTLHRRRPDMILAGVRAETGWAGGCLPYALARELDCPIVPNIDRVPMCEGGMTELHQVCPRGRRRVLRAPVPVVITVDPAAPSPRQSAFARARRGHIITESWFGPAIAAPDPGEPGPARRRPPRLRTATAGASAEQRLQALTGAAENHGRLVETDNPDEAARTILAYLAENGLIESRETDGPHK